MLRSATEIVIPAVVVGEFDFGIRQSRHYQRYADWLDANLKVVEIALCDREVAHVYGAVRFELKQAGTPIPINDTWIAAMARARSLAASGRMTRCQYFARSGISTATFVAPLAYHESPCRRSS